MLGDQKEYVPSLMGKSNNSKIDVVSIIISDIKGIKTHSLYNVIQYSN